MRGTGPRRWHMGRGEVWSVASAALCARCIGLYFIVIHARRGPRSALISWLIYRQKGREYTYSEIQLYIADTRRSTLSYSIIIPAPDPHGLRLLIIFSTGPRRLMWYGFWPTTCWPRTSSDAVSPAVAVVATAIARRPPCSDF